MLRGVYHCVARGVSLIIMIQREEYHFIYKIFSFL